MIYVISDIHGCYEEFLELLIKIDFKDEDDLYILGDLVDRGPEPIKLLQDVMMRPNVYPILGNHDYMALTVLGRLNVEITEENVDTHLTSDDMLAYMHWTQDGGAVTAKQFTKLSAAWRNDILEYLEEFSVYEEVQISDKKYILVHAGIHGFQENRALEDYSAADLIFCRPDYSRRYYQNRNTYLIIGHTPTFYIRQDRKALVYQEHGHIALDCGCVYGGRLSAYCLDTQEAFYVDSHSK